MADYFPTPNRASVLMRHAPKLKDRVRDVYGMAPRTDRLGLLPDYSPETGVVAPEWVYDLAKSSLLPGHVAQGGEWNASDVAQMGFDTMMGGGLLSNAPLGSFGMNVWQGGPHKYGQTVVSDIPSERRGTAAALQHMGKGEGNQAYGYGDYRAEAKVVGQQYFDSLKRPGGVEFGGQSVQDTAHSLATRAAKELYGKDIIDPSLPDATRQEIVRQADNAANMYASKAKPKSEGGFETDPVFIDAAIKSQRASYEKDLLARPDDEHLKIGASVSRALEEHHRPTWRPDEAYLYKHDLPDEDIARYLDWDAPLSEQQENIRDLAFKQFGFSDFDIAKAKRSPSHANYMAEKMKYTGADLYNRIVSDAGSQQAASEALGRAGIPGLKYYDGMSRGAGEGTRNYVTWDQDVLNRMKLLERNGVDMTTEYLLKAGGT